jgi:hypothetical protein
LVDDLADRLEIPREQIMLRGLRPVAWQKDSLSCPQLPDSRVPLEYAMVVTQEGTRYEETARELKPGQETSMLVLLEADGILYPYYLVDDELLACPPEK